MADEGHSPAPLTPRSAGDLVENVQSRRFRVFNRVAATKPTTYLIHLLGFESDDDEDTSEPGVPDQPREESFGRVYVLAALAPEMFGVRLGIRIEDEENVLLVDGSVEYEWKRPVEYAPDPLREFIQTDVATYAAVAVWTVLEELARQHGANLRREMQVHPDGIAAAVLTQLERKKSSRPAQQLVKEFLAGRREDSKVVSGVPALSTTMDNPTFAQATAALLEIDNGVRLRQFLTSLGHAMKPSLSAEDFERTLDLWVVFCAQALFFEHSDLVIEAIRRLGERYEKLGISNEDTRKRLATVIRFYVLGSLAVRLEQWETVASLALRPVPTNQYQTDYVYSSWIRHAQVDAARADLTSSDNGFIISAARELMVENSAMRPDLPDMEVVPDAEVEVDDALLNSLCEFDFAYCVVVFAKGTDHGAAYPSSAAFSEDRSKPMAQRIVTNAEVRHRLIPDATDAQVAIAIRELYHIAIAESAKGGSSWWGPPAIVQTYLRQNLPDSDR